MTAVPSADRTLHLFERFESVGRPLLLTELADEMQIPVSSCHGLVQTLFDRGYLYAIGARKEIYPTRKLFQVGQSLAAKDPILDRIVPIIHALRDQQKETVIVGKRQGDAVLYLEVVEGLHVIRYNARVGDFKPLHSSSIGKAVLGSLSRNELQAWLKTAQLKSMTAKTITAKARLLRDLGQGQERGYYVTRGENVVDVSAVAVPLRLNGEVFGLAVAGPSQRLRLRETEIGAGLLITSEALQKQFR
jgi:DNA-binding IclR family transcriptional regulator